jgi:hypothetical protein
MSAGGRVLRDRRCAGDVRMTQCAKPTATDIAGCGLGVLVERAAAPLLGFTNKPVVFEGGTPLGLVDIVFPHDATLHG